MKPLIKVQVPKSVIEEFNKRYKDEDFTKILQSAILHQIANLEKVGLSYKLVDYYADVDVQTVEG